MCASVYAVRCRSRYAASACKTQTHKQSTVASAVHCRPKWRSDKEHIERRKSKNKQRMLTTTTTALVRGSGAIRRVCTRRGAEGKKDAKKKYFSFLSMAGLCVSCAKNAVRRRWLPFGLTRRVGRRKWRQRQCRKKWWRQVMITSGFQPRVDISLSSLSLNPSLGTTSQQMHYRWFPKTVSKSSICCGGTVKCSKG